MTLLLEYARERLTPGRLLPAVLLLVLATLAGRGWSGSDALATDATVGLALVIAFRIWDDLADRDARSRDASGSGHRAGGVALRRCRIAADVTGVAGATLLGRTRGLASVAFLAALRSRPRRCVSPRAVRARRRGDRILLLEVRRVHARADRPAGGVSPPAGCWPRRPRSSRRASTSGGTTPESPVFSFGGSR